MPQPIQTARLLLRPFEAGDAGQIAAHIGDLDVARWLTRVPHPYDTDNSRNFIERNADKPLVFAVEAEGTLVGCMSIDEELGYWFGKPFWGQGYATEAARAVVAAYFAEHDAPLTSGYIPGNVASCNVLTKLGFVDGKRVDVHSVPLGKTVQVQKMTLSPSGWRQVS